MRAALKPAAYAIPGDIATLTGGYIYERRMLEGLRAQGRDMRHLELQDGFPFPDAAAMADAVAQLRALPPDRPVILDGLVFGSIDPEGLARVTAPVVAMVHHPLALENGLQPAQADHLYRTERANLALVAHVLVPSPHTRSILVERYGVAPDRITVAPPGTDRPTTAPAPATPPLILSVGIQHPRKGHDVLIAALIQLVDLDWRAVIVGQPWDAPHAAQLAGMAAQSGLGARLDLAGRVEQARLDTVWSQASVFALATRYEGYGIVFDEALVRGLPIVSCATGAVPDTVPQGAGLLVPPDDARAFAGALRRVLEDADLRQSLAAASAAAGARLPWWDDTARIAGEVLDAL
ncbi:glycosyltransferase family 4 protein [Citreimonas sp.]|uniref:glycosyltransferase family 4 protein n=1 Tax=Citreimonas sp. TaxID=3036715 RepID=UPI00405869DF